MGVLFTPIRRKDGGCGFELNGEGCVSTPVCRKDEWCGSYVRIKDKGSVSYICKEKGQGMSYKKI